MVRTSQQRVTVASTEPVTVGEMERYLRLDSPADARDQADLEAFLDAAREWLEMMIGQPVAKVTWDYVLAEFPDHDDAFDDPNIELPTAAESVTSITYTDSAGDSQTVSTNDYSLDSRSNPARVNLSASDWPAGSDIIIRYVQPPPHQAKQAIKMLVGHWFENRESVIVGTTANEVPQSVESLVEGLRGVLSS